MGKYIKLRLIWWTPGSVGQGLGDALSPLSTQIFHHRLKKTGISNLAISHTLATSCSRWRYLLLSGLESWLRSSTPDGVRNRLSGLPILIGESAQIGSTGLFEHTPQLRHY